MLNFCGIVVAILKMVIGGNFQCRESIRDIIIYPHIKILRLSDNVEFVRYCVGHFENGDR
jgi:hypothetical protein